MEKFVKYIEDRYGAADAKTIKDIYDHLCNLGVGTYHAYEGVGWTERLYVAKYTPIRELQARILAVALKEGLQKLELDTGNSDPYNGYVSK